MPKKLESFEIQDGQDVIKLALLQVDTQVGRKALAEYNRAFSAAVNSGALLRSALQNHMKEQNVWNDQKEDEYQELVNKLNENSKQLAAGGIKLSEARKIALDSKNTRGELRDLISERTALDTNTAEGQAENARFNFIVSEVTVNDDTGGRFFKDMDDYLEQSTTEAAVEAASRLGRLMYGLDPNYEANLPENKFLSKWKFMDDEMRLIDKEGRLIDQDGRLVNEEGRFIDEEGNFVDMDGNPIDDEGELRVEAQPFLDDEGNPIEESPEEGDSE
jgi:hypothetical protein